MPSLTRKAAILDAAAVAFTRRGFHATTVSDIAAEAGISQGLLYRYFGGKEDVVVALVERVTDELHRGVEQAETLDAALDALYDSGGETDAQKADGTLLIEVLAEALRNERVAEVVRQADARVAEALSEQLRQAQRAREVSKAIDPDAAAEVLIALADGFALRLALADEVPSGIDATVVRLLTRFLAR